MRNLPGRKAQGLTCLQSLIPRSACRILLHPAPDLAILLDTIRARSSVGQSARFTSVRSLVRAQSCPPPDFLSRATKKGTAIAPWYAARGQLTAKLTAIAARADSRRRKWTLRTARIRREVGLQRRGYRELRRVWLGSACNLPIVELPGGVRTSERGPARHKSGPRAAGNALDRGRESRMTGWSTGAPWRCSNAPSRPSSSAGPPVAATPTSPTPTPDSSPRRAVWRATSVRSTSATKHLASRTVRPIPDGRAYGRDATSSPADGNGWWCARRGSSTRTATRSPPVGTTRPSHAGPGRCGSSMPAPLPVRTPNKRPLDLPAAAGSGAATTPGWLPAAGSPSRALSTGR
jgi:hypothetical protein